MKEILSHLARALERENFTLNVSSEDGLPPEEMLVLFMGGQFIITKLPGSTRRVSASRLGELLAPRLPATLTVTERTAGVSPRSRIYRMDHGKLYLMKTDGMAVDNAVRVLVPAEQNGS